MQREVKGEGESRIQIKEVDYSIIIIQINQRRNCKMFYFQPYNSSSEPQIIVFPMNFIMPHPYPQLVHRPFPLNSADSPQTPLHTPHPPFPQQKCPKRQQIKKEDLPTAQQIIAPKQTQQRAPSAQTKASMRRDSITETDEQGKIHISIEWRNQNRNIIPNIMNQILSYITKPSKSRHVVNCIFKRQAQPSSWTPNRFYNYFKPIKDQASHHLDQTELRKFFIIHSPHSEVYSPEEQKFYLKVGRMLIANFLRNEVVLIAGTSARMSRYNRKFHLIGREILLRILRQMASQFRGK